MLEVGDIARNPQSHTLCYLIREVSDGTVVHIELLINAKLIKDGDESMMGMFDELRLYCPWAKL